MESFKLSAGPIRNKEMADNATHCIAFVAPNSRGTKSMIAIAKKSDLILKVIDISGDNL